MISIDKMKKVAVIGIVLFLLVGGIANAFPLFKESGERKYLSEISENGDGGVQNSPWPMYCHDVRHTGRSPYNTSGNAGFIKWRFEAGGWIDSSPVIDKNGTIYVPSNNYNLYSINPNGTMKWKFKCGWVERSAVIADDGTIYFGSMNEYLYALYPNGTMKWKFKTAGGIESSPAIDENGIIYGGTSYGGNKSQP
jgi:hypothetical protein